MDRLLPLSAASGGDWALELDPPVLLPSRPVAARIRYVAESDHEARAVRAVLRAVETYQFRRTADAAGVWTPSVDLRHGTARARFHVILALAWRPDIHYVRDVALASTTEL